MPLLDETFLTKSYSVANFYRAYFEHSALMARYSEAILKVPLLRPINISVPKLRIRLLKVLFSRVCVKIPKLNILKTKRK